MTVRLFLFSFRASHQLGEASAILRRLLELRRAPGRAERPAVGGRAPAHPEGLVRAARAAAPHPGHHVSQRVTTIYPHSCCVKRRQEERGTFKKSLVIDDFAHHPTAIGLAVDSLRQQYPDSRLWVIFEPRSNTTRRNIFQDELATALAKADLAVVPAVPDPEKVAESERLDPEKLVTDVKTSGTECWYCETVDEIVQLVARESNEGDTVAVLSNGGFGGIHQKLLDALG